MRWLRIIGTCLFAAWVGRYIREPEPLLHGSILIFHEAGHVLFMPLGEFMMVLGGSLFQLLVPLSVMAVFASRRDTFAVAVVGLYLAASLTDVGRYVADARAGDLPLLGGDRSNHDWTFLLIETRLLAHDSTIGAWVRGIGLVVYAASLISGLWVAWFASDGTPPGGGSPRRRRSSSPPAASSAA